MISESGFSDDFALGLTVGLMIGRDKGGETDEDSPDTDPSR
jgi:hypothetical protein